VPLVSDGVEVPGNRAIGAAEMAARQAACFTPYHDAVDQVIARVEARHGGPAALISMHSFTPVMDGYERPWHVGVLWHEDGRMPLPVIAALAADPSISVGDNEPYSGRVPVPYSVPAHAAPGDRPHITVEIRQDLIDTHHGAEAWANIMAAAFARPLADPAIYRAAEA
jgi:predicted N-formylglutamate amidohydrolase